MQVPFTNEANPSLTLRDAEHMLGQQAIHLLIIDLEYLRSIGHADWLTGIRRITLIPGQCPRVNEEARLYPISDS